MKGIGNIGSKEKIFKKQSGLRGMLSFWIIFLLRKRPMNGYELVKEIESNTKYWKPTTGAIYPTLYKLKAMGLIKVEKTGNRDQKVYTLTEPGMVLARQIIEKMSKKIRDLKSRRILDSLMWPDEPEDIQEIFETLFITIFDFRSSLKEKYRNSAAIKKTKEKLIKIIKELKVKKVK